MNYCEDCMLLDICGKEGCLDDAMTFCDDKHNFVPLSVIEDIKAEIADIYCGAYCDNPYTAGEVRERALEIIDKYVYGGDNNDEP